MNFSILAIPAAVLAVLMGLLPVHAGDLQEANQIARRWVEGQKDLKSLVIEFHQDRVLKGLKKPVASRGTIWLDRKGMMRWQVGEPPKTIAVYREREVMVIHPDKKLVEKRVMGKDTGNQAEMERAFLESGIPDSLEEFQKFFRILGVESEEGKHRLKLEVKDARAQGALVSVSFLIDPTTNLLSGYDVEFRDGSSIRTRFQKVRKNAEIDGALFNPDTSGFHIEELKP